MADALDRLQMQNMLKSAAYKRNKPGRFGQPSIAQRSQARQQMPNQAGMGYGGRPGTMMSSAPASAAESTAFNERNKNRALHGDRWNTKGGIGRRGIERERVDARRLDITERSKNRKFEANTDRTMRGREADRQDKVTLGEFGGYNPETGVKVEGTKNIEAKARKTEAARKGLTQPKPPKVFESTVTNPEGGMSTIFKEPIPGADGKRVMRTIPDQSAIPNQATVSSADETSKAKKKPGKKKYEPTILNKPAGGGTWSDYLKR